MGLLVVGFGVVGLRVVGLCVGAVGFFVVGFGVFGVLFWRFRDAFNFASSSPLLFSSFPFRFVCAVAVAETHPFITGCQVHSPVPARHEVLVVKDAQPSMGGWGMLPRKD